MKGDVFTCLTAVLGADGSVTSRDQLVTASAVSSSSIDLLAQKDISPGKKIRLYIATVAAVTAAGAATVLFELIQADDAALTDDIIVIGQSPVIGKALLPAGAPPVVIEASPVFPLATGAPALTNRGRRFLGCRFTVATGPLTGATPQFRAYITPDTDMEPRLYPSGWNAVGT